VAWSRAYPRSIIGSGSRRERRVHAILAINAKKKKYMKTFMLRSKVY
jgi:hypothetical protein